MPALPFMVDPVLYMTATGNSSHMAWTTDRKKSICGRTLDYTRTQEYYAENALFLRPVCVRCKSTVETMLRNGEL